MRQRLQEPKRWTPKQLRDIAYRYEWEGSQQLKSEKLLNRTAHYCESLDYCGIKQRPVGSASWNVQKRRAFSRRAAEGLEGKEIQTSLFDQDLIA